MANDKTNESDPERPIPTDFRHRATEDSEFGKRSRVYDTKPVEPKTVNEIMNTAAPLLGTPVQSSSSTSEPASTDSES